MNYSQNHNIYQIIYKNILQLFCFPLRWGYTPPFSLIVGAGRRNVWLSVYEISD